MPVGRIVAIVGYRAGKQFADQRLLALEQRFPFREQCFFCIQELFDALQKTGFIPEIALQVQPVLVKNKRLPVVAIRAYQRYGFQYTVAGINFFICFGEIFRFFFYFIEMKTDMAFASFFRQQISIRFQRGYIKILRELLVYIV